MNPNHSDILVIEDDKQIQIFLKYVLEKEHYACQQAETGEQALTRLEDRPADVILLDLGLPDIDGMDLITKIRSRWDTTPILVISARDQDEEKAAALDLGADDYLTKPFSSTELLARIRTALRHCPAAGKPAGKVGELTLDRNHHRALLGSREIHLTPLEYKLLETFFESPGKVLTTQMIIQSVYGIQYAQDTRALRTLMAGLRRKIEPDPGHPRYILTEIGVGYRLADA
ncbi:response regulator transcription factor [Faecalibaculum rodentium]|jgi:two-component system KDP operon response regulator KdpE|uniref:response regulator transcription factor n=1 Tax=Faecalibaculum rodentium TaxID=1702221 RepID=UPI001F5A2C01|nr:response regulator transcription factor [Faecalibaculum rodentium]